MATITEERGVISKFGRDSELISRFGFGAWGIGGGMWQGTSDRQSIAALEEYLHTDLPFIDTAFSYGRGHSESLIGQVLKERASRAFVATKIPPAMSQWPMPDGIPFQRAFPRDHIWRCTETSLERLKLSRLDLQQFHVWSDTWAREDEWKRIVDDLRSQGVVRNFGVSVNEYQPWNVLETVRTGFIDSIQVIFNLLEQAPIDELFPLCLERGISVIAREPLDTGFLTGFILPNTEFPANDWRRKKFSDEYFQEAMPRLDELKGVSAECGVSCADLALRFAGYHGAVSIVIPGMRSAKHVIQNRETLGRGPLPDDLVEQLVRCRWDRRQRR